MADRRVTQTLIEVDGDWNPKLRATQVLIEVDLDESVAGETIELQGASRAETTLSGAVDVSVILLRYLVGGVSADTRTTAAAHAAWGLAGAVRDDTALSAALSRGVTLMGAVRGDTSLTSRLALLHLLYAKSVAEVSPKAYLNAARVLAGAILGNTRLAGRLKSGQIMLLLGLLAEDTSITGRAQVDRGVAGQIEQESTAGGNLAIDRGLRGTMHDEPDWTGAMSAHYGLTGGLEQALDTNARLNLRMWLLGELGAEVMIDGQMFKRPHLKFPVSLIPEAHLTTLRVEPHEDNVTVEIHAKEVNV